MVTFDTAPTTLAARSAARVLPLTPANEVGVPGTVISPAMPTGTTGALVAFDAADGSVVTVISYAANRGAGMKQSRSGGAATFTGGFTAIFDASGKNLAPGGAKSVTIDEKTGKLLRFD